MIPICHLLPYLLISDLSFFWPGQVGRQERVPQLQGKTALSISSSFRQLSSVPKMDPFQEDVGQEALERYIQLEEEIALLEASSPVTLLKNKRDQLDTLNRKIEDQEELVHSLEENT